MHELWKLYLEIWKGTENVQTTAMEAANEDAVENAEDLRKLLIFNDNVKIYRTKMQQMQEIYVCVI